MIIRVGYLPFRIYGFVLCRGIIIFHKDATDAMLAHEKVHEKEWSPLWLWKYLISPVFRMKAEVRAYAAQAKLEGKPLKSYEKLITDNYMLNNEAKTLLPFYMQVVEG